MRSRGLARALATGALYATIVFAVGFVLGLARVLVLADIAGELGAVLIELPVILAIAWFVCGALIHAMQLPATPGAGLTMGASAFGVLMFFEIALSLLIFDAGLAGLWQRWTTAPGLAGLLGQLAFAGFAVLRLAGARQGR